MKKGTRHSQEAKTKMSKAKKGKYIGKKHHLFGKHLSFETRKKISESHKGKTVSKETGIKISKALKGKYVGKKRATGAN